MIVNLSISVQSFTADYIAVYTIYNCKQWTKVKIDNPPLAVHSQVRRIQPSKPERLSWIKEWRFIHITSFRQFCSSVVIQDKMAYNFAA